MAAKAEFAVEDEIVSLRKGAEFDFGAESEERWDGI